MKSCLVQANGKAVVLLTKPQFVLNVPLRVSQMATTKKPENWILVWQNYGVLRVPVAT